MLLEFGGQHRWIFGPTPQAFPRMLGYKSFVVAASRSTSSISSSSPSRSR
jgi:hypothetical protein